MSNGAELAAAEDEGAPAAEHDDAVGGDGEPGARARGVLDLEARGAVLEDHAERAVVAVRAAPVLARRARRLRRVVAEAEVEVTGAVQGRQVDALALATGASAQGRQQSIHVPRGEVLEESEHVREAVGRELLAELRADAGQALRGQIAASGRRRRRGPRRS